MLLAFAASAVRQRQRCCHISFSLIRQYFHCAARGLMFAASRRAPLPPVYGA
jgi:hypothetical protein